MCLWKPPRRFFIACFPNILASFVFEVRHRIGFDGTQGRQVLGQSKPRASLSSVPHMLARNDALPGQDERSQATKVEQISIIYLVLGPFQIHHDPSLGSREHCSYFPALRSSRSYQVSATRIRIKGTIS